MIMRILTLLTLCCALSGCLTNADGSDAFTYSSCRITSSTTMNIHDRNVDINHCWNATGNGYELRSEAVQWCEKEVNAYIGARYSTYRSMTYAVESTYCQ